MPSSKNLPQQHGILILNKPKGPTSAGCLERIKHVLGQKKIGHAGTLDPMASGQLIVLLGRATRLASYYAEGSKTYVGELLLGTTTETYDLEGRITAKQPWEQVTKSLLRAEVKGWLSQKVQVIPRYSAAKHQGSPLYKLSREGRKVPIKTKPLHVFQAEVISVTLPKMRFRVSCGAGTYIRSLVHSLGIRIGCGAVLTELIRERSHPFRLEEAYNLNVVLDEPDALPERILSLSQALPHWSTLLVGQATAQRLKYGAPVDAVGYLAPEELPIPAVGADPISIPDHQATATRRTLVVTEDGQTQCLAELRRQDDKLVWVVLRGLW
ncbi:tRNA pseudouridine synthase B [Desulfovibrionales bacterium]